MELYVPNPWHSVEELGIPEDGCSICSIRFSAKRMTMDLDRCHPFSDKDSPPKGAGDNPAHPLLFDGEHPAKVRPPKRWEVFQSKTGRNRSRFQCDGM